MSLSRTILEAIAEKGDWMSFDQVCAAVIPNGDWRKRQAISARLAQLVDVEKLRRRGAPRAYDYHATKFSLLDLRKVTRNGKPRNAKAAARQARRGQPRVARAPKPDSTWNGLRTAPKPKPHQALVIVPAPNPITQPPKAAAARESVEDFLRRGGRIERLANGVVSKPLKHIGLSAARKRAPRRARNPVTDPETD